MFKKLEAVAEKYDKLQPNSKERSEIEDVVQHFRSYKALLSQIKEAEEISQDKSADPELRQMAEVELKELGPKIQQSETRQASSLPSSSACTRATPRKNAGSSRSST